MDKGRNIAVFEKNGYLVNVYVTPASATAQPDRFPGEKNGIHFKT